MYPLSIHSHISHSNETIISTQDGGFPARMNRRKNEARQPP
jgi:hypothetical protein